MRPLRIPGPPTAAAFTSRLRSEGVTARVGTWVGVCFGVCFLTGLISHNYYLAHPWLPLPTRPIWGYRVTQGLHIVSGTAAIPLLLIKLWSVYPKLFVEVPTGRLRALVLHLLERVSIAVLVAASITELAIGLANIAEWYPWKFGFRPTHYALAWVVVGALLVHIAVKLPVIRRAYAAPLADPVDPATGPTRRDLLRTAGVAAGVAAIGTAGIAVPGLRHVSVFGVHSGGGPEDLPVTKSATEARVTVSALDPAWRLEVVCGGRSHSLSRADLSAMTQHTVLLPIACVEGWSKNGRWTGVRLRDVLDLVDAPRAADLAVSSLQPHGGFGRSELPGRWAADPLTLLALGLNGEPLAIDHGYPCRLIAPNRPGVMQTKWLSRLEVL